MSPPEKHPHIDRPSEDQLSGLLQGRDPIVSQLYLQVHRLVLETLPEVAYSVDCQDGGIGYGARQYGYNGWGLAALAAYSKWVSLTFMRGADLNNSDNLLEGTGKSMRHVKLGSAKDFDEKHMILRKLLKAASKLNG